MLALKELLHNLKDRDWDANPIYKIDENEADKIIKQLERLDKIFINADEIESNDEIFKDDYSDKNIQNGWIMCEDRLPNINEWVLCHCQAGINEILRWTEDGWYKDDSQCYMKSFVIAWQPLPQFYKAESEETE
jgi:hypothetical protein